LQQTGLIHRGLSELGRPPCSPLPIEAVAESSESNMSGPVTLGDLIEAKKLLWVHCCDCGHERDVDPATLPLSWDTPVPFISTHTKCSVCGSRKINTKPELYAGGLTAMRGSRQRS
jgi:hypothetical protein